MPPALLLSCSVPAASPSLTTDHWQPVVPEQPGTAIEDMDMTRDWLVLFQRVQGQQQVAALALRDGLPATGTAQPPGRDAAADVASMQSAAGAAAQHPLGSHEQKERQQQPSAPPLTPAPLPSWALSVVAGANADFDSPTLRLMLSSPVHPEATFDWQLGSQSLVLRTGAAVGEAAAARGQQQPGGTRSAAEAAKAAGDAGGGRAELVWQRLWARSADGTAVPLTVAHRADLQVQKGSCPGNGASGGSDGSSWPHPAEPQPCLLVVYGAYGHCLPTEFAPERLPLLRDGWVLALAHVRGGGELGRRWHAAGRGGAKANSVADLEACLDHLFAAGELWGSDIRQVAAARPGGTSDRTATVPGGTPASLQ